ncbi:MAG: tetratricopeptide repeat protein [Chitinophagales bacterium]
MNYFKTILFAAIAFVSLKASADSSDFAEIIEHGIELYDKGDYKGALDLYKLAQKIDTKSGLLNYEMASTYYAMKDTAKAIEHCKKSIASADKLNDQAYVLYGTILEAKGNVKEAIEQYKAGIKIYPNSSILYYNLALTSFNNYDDKSAEENAKKAVTLNPLHASSHLVLGYTMVSQKKRVEAVFAFYNFLLLEPTGQKAEKVYKELSKQLSRGVSYDSTKTLITMPKNESNETLRNADIMLSMIAANNNSAENKAKPSAILFYQNTKTFFAYLEQLKPKTPDFWSKYYVNFYTAMNKAGHTEAFCYYISQTKYHQDISFWLKDNKKKTDALKSWNAKFVRKY